MRGGGDCGSGIVDRGLEGGGAGVGGHQRACPAGAVVSGLAREISPPIFPAPGLAGRREDGFEVMPSVAGDRRANDTRSLVAQGPGNFDVLKCHSEFTEVRSSEAVSLGRGLWIAGRRSGG